MGNMQSRQKPREHCGHCDVLPGHATADFMIIAEQSLCGQKTRWARGMAYSTSISCRT